MKTLKHIVALVMAVLTALSLGTKVLAQDVNSNQNGQGSITITNASQGQEYIVYKLFDATVAPEGVGADGKGISYKLPAGKTKANFGGGDWFDVDAKGNITAKAGADLTTPAFRQWAETNGTEVARATAADNTLAFKNLQYGYYYVKSPLGSVITVDSTTPNATVIDKNEVKPNIPDENNGGGKKIVTNGTTTASKTSAKIGETVNFQIKFNATNFVTTAGVTKQIVSYTIKDTPTALKINENSVEVTVGGQPVVPTKTFDGNAMTLVLSWVGANNKTIYNSPSEVIVKYSAVVTKDAKDGQAKNTADIGYNTIDNPNTPPTPVDPNKPQTTTVTTHRFTLKKVNEGNVELTGAEFKLYASQTGADEIALVKDGNGNEYRVAEAGEQGEVVKAGTAVIKGLKADTTYYLEETKAPDGYNILTERQAIEVKADNNATATVKNLRGGELPATGAIGTTLFYLIGSLLLIGLLVYSISKRRMNNI